MALSPDSTAVWNSIRSIIAERVIPLMATPDNGIAWLSALEVAEDGHRLGACIAIDVLAGAIDSLYFSAVLDKIDLVIPDARHSFAKAVGEPPPDTLICASRFCADHSDETYVRVLELSTFIEFYVRPTYYKVPFDPEDVNDVREDFFGGEAGQSWPDLTVEFSGTFGRVFVTSLTDFEAVLNDAAYDRRGTVVNDAFGLNLDTGVGTDNHPEFVAVKYPQAIEETSHQPTTFDVSWVYPGAFYLSFKDLDLWGRTQSCTGKGRQVRERVHKRTVDTMARFEGVYIGVSERLSPDRAQLLEEAFVRASELIDQ